eukprot:758319-Hanusia_phi.AAC.5
MDRYFHYPYPPIPAPCRMGAEASVADKAEEGEGEEGPGRRKRSSSKFSCSDDWDDESGTGGLFCSSEALDGCKWSLQEVQGRASAGVQPPSTRFRHPASHPVYPTQLHEEASFLVPISSGEWHSAANNGDLETLSKLLDQGTDVNMVDELGFTGLKAVFIFTLLPFFPSLLLYISLFSPFPPPVAHVDPPSLCPPPQSFPALHVAALRGDRDMVEFLYNRAADLSAATYFDKKTAVRR